MINPFPRVKKKKKGKKGKKKWENIGLKWNLKLLDKIGKTFSLFFANITNTLGYFLSSSFKFVYF